MHVNLHKRFLVTLLIMLILIPFSVHAQGKVSLDAVNVQLWPEFDQPDMLVIMNIQIAPSVSLPASLTFKLPGSVEKPYVVAVGPTAQTVSDQGIDFSYKKNGNWLEVTINAEYPAVQIEYYAPLEFSGSQRDYVYSWTGDYDVSQLNLSLKVPVDTTEISTDPDMERTTPEGSSQTFLNWEGSNLDAGKQVSFTINYTKTSDRLSMAEQPLETGTVDENTQGRVSLDNILPYILGGVGILLIAVGGIYFWQTSKGKPEPRKRHRAKAQDDNGDIKYCHQCGKRAQASDRFCRTCGTRLRKET